MCELSEILHSLTATDRLLIAGLSVVCLILWAGAALDLRAARKRRRRTPFPGAPAFAVWPQVAVAGCVTLISLWMLFMLLPVI